METSILYDFVGLAVFFLPRPWSVLQYLMILMHWTFESEQASWQAGQSNTRNLRTFLVQIGA